MTESEKQPVGWLIFFSLNLSSQSQNNPTRVLNGQNKDQTNRQLYLSLPVDARICLFRDQFDRSPSCLRLWIIASGIISFAYVWNVTSFFVKKKWTHFHLVEYAFSAKQHGQLSTFWFTWYSYNDFPQVNLFLYRKFSNFSFSFPATQLLIIWWRKTQVIFFLLEVLCCHLHVFANWVCHLG